MHYQECVECDNRESQGESRETTSDERGGLDERSREWSNLQLISHHQETENKTQEVALDSATTRSLFCNKKLVSNIRKSDKDVEIETNTGTGVMNQTVDEPLVGEVMFSESAIANLYALNDLCARY